MTTNEYLENNQKAFNEGKISAEAYDAALLNMSAFVDDDDEQKMLILEQQGGII
jgi:hypothetical protein